MKDAPARISMIMQVMRVVPITLALNESQESEPDHHAMASDPSTPQAAHSVAVAQPSMRDRNTRTIRKVIGMRFVEARSFSRNVMGGSGGGERSGCRRDQTAM